MFVSASVRFCHDHFVKSPYCPLPSGMPWSRLFTSVFITLSMVRYFSFWKSKVLEVIYIIVCQSGSPYRGSCDLCSYDHREMQIAFWLWHCSASSKIGTCLYRWHTEMVSNRCYVPPISCGTVKQMELDTSCIIYHQFLRRYPCVWVLEAYSVDSYSFSADSHPLYSNIQQDKCSCLCSRTWCCWTWWMWPKSEYD